jgi:hypothetical protein
MDKSHPSLPWFPGAHNPKVAFSEGTGQVGDPALTFGTGRTTSIAETATKTASKIDNTKMRRFIRFLLWKVLVGSQVGALQCPCFDLNQDLSFAALAETDYTCNRLRLEVCSEIGDGEIGGGCDMHHLLCRVAQGAGG